MELKGRVIKNGKAHATAVVCRQALSLLGGIDPDTGEILTGECKGQNAKCKILVFPHGIGSTVGSYVLYRMKKNGTAPAGIINEECEPIVAVGAIISDIPCVDRIDTKAIKTGDVVEIDGETVTVN